jgi:hypothetical protein
MSFITKSSAALLICTLLPPAAFSQAVSEKDKRDILQRARDSYYNLPKQGLANFSCDVVPNFGDMEAELREANPEAADNWAKEVAQIHISVTVGPDGQAKVTRSEIADENLKVIADDTDQMVTDFFALWSPYVVGTALPATDAEYELEDLGSEYRLSFKTGPASSVITLDKELTVGARIVTGPNVNSATWPQFTKTANGFLAASIDSDLRIPAKGGATHVAASITYQEVSGLQLPKTIREDITSGDNYDDIEVDLTGCTATKR